MDNIQNLKGWLGRNPGPWTVTMWTCPEDGRNPAEFTAGYIAVQVDNWEEIDGIMRFWSQNDGSNLALVSQAVGVVEEVVSEGHVFARFAYVNISPAASGFIPYVIFSIDHCA